MLCISPRSRATSRTGFTLVELLVVVGVIAVLIALLMPALSKARQQASRLRCMSSLRQLHIGLVCYVNDNDGYIPVAPTIAGVWQYDYGGWIPMIQKYVGYPVGTTIPTASVFYCQEPATGTWSAPRYKWTYAINRDLRIDRKVNKIKYHFQTFVFTENGAYGDVLHHHFLEYGFYGHPSAIWAAGPAHGGGRGVPISYLDGHAEFWAPTPPRATYQSDRKFPWTHRTFWGYPFNIVPTEYRGAYVAPYVP